MVASYLDASEQYTENRSEKWVGGNFFVGRRVRVRKGHYEGRVGTIVQATITKGYTDERPYFNNFEVELESDITPSGTTRVAFGEGYLLTIPDEEGGEKSDGAEEESSGFSLGEATVNVNLDATAVNEAMASLRRAAHRYMARRASPDPDNKKRDRRRKRYAKNIIRALRVANITALEVYIERSEDETDPDVQSRWEQNTPEFFAVNLARVMDVTR
jgi:hypothetical protein